jgi:hypothetical protein
MNKFLWEREADIIKWGEDRNIIGANAQATFEGQQEKTRQEWEEWKRDHSRDDLGDIFVTLVMQCALKGTTVSNCVRDCFDDFDRFLGINQKNLLDGCDDRINSDIEDLLRMTSNFTLNIAYVITALDSCAKKRGWTLEECIEVAWNDIKDRKGLMVHGMFIKQVDLNSLCDNGVHYEPDQVCFRGVLFSGSHLDSVCGILSKLSLDYETEGAYDSGVELKTIGRI